MRSPVFIAIADPGRAKRGLDDARPFHRGATMPPRHHPEAQEAPPPSL